MKKWEIQNNFQFSIFNFQIEKLIDLLLQNRGIKTKKEREEFLNPKLEEVTINSVGINKTQLKKALKRIQKAIEQKEQIVVFGDYDVDGICGSAILWETLHDMGAKAMPYIPHRIEEGYGLSIKGIEKILTAKVVPSLRTDLSKTKLIITVDNGIVATEAVEFANKKNIDVIITDHHVPSKKLPKAYAIVHTTKLCGTGVAYMLAQEFKNAEKVGPLLRTDLSKDNHLELVALATVADLVPLLGENRTLTKFGLEKLRETKRVGLIELFKEAALDPSTIGVYEVGHIIAPRLNAMGRLEFAMESLRLLCTKNRERAEALAHKLGKTNRERQIVTQETTIHAVTKIKDQKSKIKNLLFIAHESYQEGVIGLVAGKLVEEFCRPSIVVSKGEKVSKASARSVRGFNIIEFIRLASKHLINAGGHPMAAGFTVETEKITVLQEFLEQLSEKHIYVEMLTRTLRIDCELPVRYIDISIYNALQQLAPFGMGNPDPMFVSRGVYVEDIRLVGKDKKHIKLRFVQPSATSNQPSVALGGIGFGLGEKTKEVHTGDKADIVYTISLDVWNGNNKLQLKVKDIKKS